MEALDFTDKEPNEILTDLAAATDWLRDQFAAAKLVLPAALFENAATDPETMFFWSADVQHLRVVSACVRKHIVVPPSPPVMLDPNP